MASASSSSYDTPDGLMTSRSGAPPTPLTRSETLPAVLRQAIDLPDAERFRLQNAAMTRVQDRYSWDAITTQYERLFETLRG